MKYILLTLILYGGWACAQPDELHNCLAWLSAYGVQHQDKQVSELGTRFETELKESKIFNPTQFQQASDDHTLVSSAQSSPTGDTNRTLSYCTKLAVIFTR